MRKLYKVSIVIYNVSWANIDNRYVYTDFSAMVWLPITAKTANCC